LAYDDFIGFQGEKIFIIQKNIINKRIMHKTIMFSHDEFIKDLIIVFDILIEELSENIVVQANVNGNIDLLILISLGVEDAI
jgi:hypothetical protein